MHTNSQSASLGTLPTGESVPLLQADRRRHVYIIGQTGTGKTGLMTHLMRTDLLAGSGFCFLDPHGDAAAFSARRSRMRIRIEREREERQVPAGWFARARIPAYCIFLTVTLSEEERLLIRHAGLTRSVFFRAPIPPDVVDPEKIKQLKVENFGLVLTGDLLGFGRRTLLEAWPDLISADDAEAMLRQNLEEFSMHLTRASGETEVSVEYEL